MQLVTCHMSAYRNESQARTPFMTRSWMKVCRNTLCQVAALFCLKWRIVKAWRQIENPTPLIDAYSRIHLENNPAKFHSDPIWNDGALGFFDIWDLPRQMLRRTSRMSSNMGSVPDPKRMVWDRNGKLEERWTMSVASVGALIGLIYNKQMLVLIVLFYIPNCVFVAAVICLSFVSAACL